MTRTDLTLRQATPQDLPVVAELLITVREAAYPAMPPGLHPPHDARAYVGRWDLSACDVWLAESDGRLVGYARVGLDWLDDLYVDTCASGTGVGSALLDLVKAQRPHGFCLWVFESNQPARRFYRNRGLVELERTDGSGNEEQAPDVRMAWPGLDPVRFFRRLIDEVDAELGDLLARRAALTAAVQTSKSEAGRDPAREREIAAALAHRAPALGEERLARIVHTIITESVAAAGE